MIIELRIPFLPKMRVGMVSVRKLRQVLLLFSLIAALWFGVVVIWKQLPDSTGISQYLIEKYVPIMPLEKLEFLQEQRKKLVKDVCGLASQDSHQVNITEEKDIYDHIIVDDDHQLLYCYVPKVACTNWKRVLMILMGKVNTTDPLLILPDDSHRSHVFRRLSNYSSEDILFRLDTYLKFMFVRHPFERLISAFRNKFYQNYSSSEYFRARYGKHIIKHFRPNASNESLARGHDVTFREFVQYLLDPKTTYRSVYNEHWRPIVELCRPCRIQYDVIGKYETLMDDAWLVLEKSNMSHSIQFPKSSPSTTPAMIAQYMDSLSWQQIQHLYYIYELDFRLFDYDYQGLQ